MSEHGQTCGICGGDGRIGNTFGASKTCPSCLGSGRRAEDRGFHDVTKTKTAPARGPQGGRGKDGQVVLSQTAAALAREVRDCTTITDAVKKSLFNDIVQYEAAHGALTDTFLKKIRKRMRPAG